MIIEVNNKLIDTKELLFYTGEAIKLMNKANKSFESSIQKVLSKDMKAAEYIREVYVAPADAQADIVLDKIINLFEEGSHVS